MRSTGIKKEESFQMHKRACNDDHFEMMFVLSAQRGSLQASGACSAGDCSSSHFSSPNITPFSAPAHVKPHAPLAATPPRISRPQPLRHEHATLQIGLPPPIASSLAVQLKGAASRSAPEGTISMGRAAGNGGGKRRVGGEIR